MQIVDGPVGTDELVLAGVPVLVVERRGPVVRLVVLNFDTRTRAFAELFEVVGISKIAATCYTVNVLAKVGARASDRWVTLEHDVTNRGDAIGGNQGVHSSSEQIGSAHTPAGIDIVRVRDEKECNCRKESGGHGRPVYSKKDEREYQDETFGRFR